MSPALRSVSRRELVQRLRAFGFQGPYAGAKHQFMVRGDHTIRNRNPHGSDIGVPLLRELLRQACIDPTDWVAQG